MDTEKADEVEPKEDTGLTREETHNSANGAKYNSTEDVGGEKAQTVSHKSFLSLFKMPFYSQERVSWFAIILLLILFYIYVLNQADRLVLPVLIPAGLRCDYSKDNVTCLKNIQEKQGLTKLYTEGSGNDSNSTTNAPSETGCVDFNEFEQGLLTGPAFIVIYVLAGLPLGYLADRRSRPLVLISGFLIWSVAIVLTGFVAYYWELVLLRIVLGIGEVC